MFQSKSEKHLFFIIITLLLIGFSGAFGVTGCTALQNKTPTETAFEATHTITGFYRSIARLRDSERITKEVGHDLYAKVDRAEMALKTARIALSFDDKKTAQANMFEANRLLLEIDKFIKSKESEAPP